MLVLLSCLVPHITSCWNIWFWLKNKEFVGLHDVAAYHMRARRIVPSSIIIAQSSDPPPSACPSTLCSQKPFVEVSRSCQKHPGRLANDSETAAGVRNVLRLFGIHDQHIMNQQMKIQSPLWALTSKGTTFQLARPKESCDELAC